MRHRNKLCAREPNVSNAIKGAWRSYTDIGDYGTCHMRYENINTCDAVQAAIYNLIVYAKSHLALLSTSQTVQELIKAEIAQDNCHDYPT